MIDRASNQPEGQERALIQAARRAALTGQALPVGLPAGLLSDSFPGYEIRREIHRGGQGVVCLALQKATGREVALKVVREGLLGGRGEQARFEREVHILATLKHPNIVAIHDSGSAGGYVYYVMDYVAGEPLDRFVARRRPTVLETLRLFVKICDAVHAAHLRGVIHRDLKPGNIIIGSDGEPYVLDFGLAKLTTTDSFAGAQEAVTVTGQFVGSVPWASPEQALGRSSAIDLRTDVYSLGVILYQILAGRFPYNVSGSVRDVLNNIATAAPAALSAYRKGIGTEVETIVRRCLAKEPERRYQSAGELARDIERYLRGEPIDAKRDSGWYLLRKTLSRHKLATAFAATLTILIVGSAVAMSIMYRHAQRQAELARLEQQRAVQLEQVADQRRRDAEEEAENAKRIQGFLRNTLAWADPQRARGRDMTIRELLDDAAQRIDEEFPDQPHTQASLRQMIGGIYLQRGEYDAAQEQFTLAMPVRQEALGPVHPDTLATMKELALVLSLQGRVGEAEALIRDTIETSRKVLGDGHQQTLQSLHHWARVLEHRGKLVQSEIVYRQVLASYRGTLGEDHSESLRVMNDLARLLEARGRFDEAEQLCRNTLDVRRRTDGMDSPATLDSMNNLASVLRASGRFDEAKEINRETLERMGRVLGEQHPKTLIARHNLAWILSEQGRVAEAEPLYHDVMDTALRVHGKKHPCSLAAMNNMARFLHAQGRPQEAVPLFREVLEIIRGLLGERHPNTLLTMSNLSLALMDEGKLDEAEVMSKQAWEAGVDVLPRGHYNTSILQCNYGKCLLGQNRFEEAEHHLLACYEGFTAVFDPEHHYTHRALRRLAELYEAWGRPEQAAAHRTLLGSAADDAH